MTRVAIYARFSSDNQSEASIEDQIRICTEHAKREGWHLTETYADYAISGAFILNRPGMRNVIRDARSGEYDIVLAEALDRFSRDQEDTAAFYKRMQFCGIKVFTLSEGEITSLHVGLKGTMNALFLKDLSDKTRRGLRGRVEKGMSGGGNAFGYDVVKRFDPVTQECVRGERSINQAEAEIVQRIFKEYVAGISPRSIAHALNREGVSGPQGGEWGPSTIYGNRERGTGILNNELYIGKLVWNRLRYIKDPDTGKRVSKPNPPEAIVVKDVPELQIIDNELWEATKRLQGEINRKDTPLWKKNRPKNLFSHLIKCGCCGGGVSMVSTKKLGCSTVRNKGTCSNMLTIERETLEQMVLASLSEHLMDEQLCAAFCKEYTRRMNELRMEHNASLSGYRAELAKLERERQQIIQSILDGVPGAVLKDRATALQNRKEHLETLLANVKEEPVLFHPNMANRYHQEIRQLLGVLNSNESRSEATQILRSLIDRIVVTPTETGERLTVDLIGDLAGILAVATKRDRRSVNDDLSKFQSVQRNGRSLHDLDDAEGEEDSYPHMSEALVAGTRSRRQVIQGAPEYPFNAKKASSIFNAACLQEALVAGARTYRSRHSLKVPV